MLWLSVHMWLYGLPGFRDDTLTAFVDPGAVYVLEEMDGAAPRAEITAQFPAMWRMEWHSVCAEYRGKITLPYPWFDVVAVRAVETRCAGMDGAFLGALGTMTLAEAQGELLILSNDAGDLLVFRVQP